MRCAPEKKAQKVRERRSEIKKKKRKEKRSGKRTLSLFLVSFRVGGGDWFATTGSELKTTGDEFFFKKKKLNYRIFLGHILIFYFFLSPKNLYFIF